jgi:hypothetical protein
MRRRRVRTRVGLPLAIAAAIALIAGSLLPAAPARADPVWSVTPAPSPATSVNTGLWGVACTGASSCFAVGSSQRAQQSPKQLIERWNGNAWSTMTNPRGLSAATLSDVACPATANCFAVGSRSGKALAEFWNGHTWSLMKAPSPRGIRVRLIGIACPTRTSCVAVGSYWPTANRQRPLAEHWNGKTWAIMTTPTLADGYIAFSAIACPSAKSCFAVGTRLTGSGNTTTLVEHWNGTKWATMTSANVGGSAAGSLTGIACVNGATCFAVGDVAYPTRSLPDVVPLIEKWNGSHWAIVASPIPGTNNFSTLFDVRCATAANCLAVGGSGQQTGPGTSSFEHTLTEHWDGTAWSIVDGTSPTGSVADGFDALTCIGAGPCFGVGAYALPETCTDTACSQPTYALAERYA